MQLCSANLPTGAYAFSQGLETATEEAWLKNVDDTYDWLTLQLRYNLGYTELPLLIRMLNALQNKDHSALQQLNAIALSLRETKEFRLNDVATGQALMRVLKGLKAGVEKAALDEFLQTESEISFISAFAIASYQCCLLYTSDAADE